MGYTLTSNLDTPAKRGLTADTDVNLTQYTKHYRYTASGEVEVYSPSGSSLEASEIENSVLWNSRRYDAQTQLHYYKYRHYQPVTGRWPSRDPIGEKGGINLYAFVSNSPIHKWDRLGLIEDTSDALDIDPWDLFEMNGWDRLLNPLSSLNNAFAGNLTPKVKTTADGKCEGGKPVIENEKHTLLGNTGGGVDITIWKIGYRLTYKVKINSSNLESEETKKEGDCCILTKKYKHDLMVDFDYVFGFSKSGTIDINDVTTTLTQKCCK